VQAGGGVALIVAGGGLGSIVVFALWHRMSSSSALLLVSALGVVIGTGALLLQRSPEVADWIVTLSVLAVGTPVHCRWVFGPPGPPRSALAQPS